MSNLLTRTSGGIKQSNLLRTLHGSVSSTGHSLDGVAVVSEIVASRDPKTISEELRSILNIFKDNTASFKCTSILKPDTIVEEVIKLMGAVKESNPLIHQVCTTHFVSYISHLYRRSPTL